MQTIEQGFELWVVQRRCHISLLPSKGAIRRTPSASAGSLLYRIMGYRAGVRGAIDAPSNSEARPLAEHNVIATVTGDSAAIAYWIAASSWVLKPAGSQSAASLPRLSKLRTPDPPISQSVSSRVDGSKTSRSAEPSPS
jgi:hypothetical protein